MYEAKTSKTGADEGCEPKEYETTTVLLRQKIDYCYR